MCNKLSWSVANYTYKDTSTQTCVNACPVNPSLYRYNLTYSCVSACPSPYFAV